MRQSVVQRLWGNLVALSAAKKAGLRVGRIQFKSRVDSVPLKQFGYTYDLDRKRNKIRLQGIKPWIPVRGMGQIPEGSEIANAHLTRRCGDFFLKVTTFSQHGKAKPSHAAIGIDLGCMTALTLSNGIKIDLGVAVPKNVRKTDRNLARKRRTNEEWKKSKEYREALSRRRKAYGKWTNKKTDIRNKVVSILTKAFGTICVQDDCVKGWQAGGHGKAVSRTNIGGIKTALKNKAATLGLVDRFVATTQTCSCCGARKKMECWERVYDCPACGARMDRDWNAAVNTLNEGLNKLPAECRTPMPLEDEVSSLLELLNRVPGVQATLCPEKVEASPVHGQR